MREDGGCAISRHSALTFDSSLRERDLLDSFRVTLESDLLLLLLLLLYLQEKSARIQREMKTCHSSSDTFETSEYSIHGENLL